MVFFCIFQTLDLPLGRKDSSSQSASTASTTTNSPTAHSPSLSPSLQTDAFTTPSYGHFGPAIHQHLHRVHYIPRLPAKQTTSPPVPPPLSPTHTSSETAIRSSNLDSNGHTVDEIWVKGDSRIGSEHVKPTENPLSTPDDNIEMAVDYSYVQFARSRPSLHEYSYPTLDTVSNKSPQRHDSISELKKHNLDVLGSQPPLPSKKKRKDRTKREKRQSKHLLGPQRTRCVYCHDWFHHDDNHRGKCEDAPDKVAECIEKASCICCARGVLYHCMADADGDYGHPCVCDSTDSNNCKKWTALTILAFFVPCLWCYWPLTACHRCGVACGCCGARHKAA